MEEKSMGRSFLILSISGILVKLLSALYMPFLVAIIGMGGYGIYSSSYNIFIFIFALTSLGAQPAITKVVREFSVVGNHNDALRTMKIARKYLGIIGIVITVIFFVLSDFIVRITNINPNTVLSLKFLTPTIALTTILASYRGYIQGIEDMKTLAISTVLEQFTNVIVSLLFAFILIGISIEWGSAGGTVGTSIGALVAIIFIMYIYEKNDYENIAIKNDKSNSKISEKKIVKKLMAYGLPITLVGGMQNAGGLIDTINVQQRLKFAAGFAEDYATELFGILTSYNTLLYVPLTIITALSTAIFTKVIESYVQKNIKELKRQMSYSFRITYMIAIPSAFGLSILSREIYILLFGESMGYELLMYGSVVLIFMSITTIQNTILQGINKLYLVLLTAFTGISIKFIVNYILVGIPSINILGAIIGSLISFLVPAIINHKKLQRIFKIRIPIIRQAVPSLISAIIMSIVIWICRGPLLRVLSIVEGGRLLTGLIILVLISLGGAVYLITMIAIGGIKKLDLDMISPKLYIIIPRFLRKMM